MDSFSLTSAFVERSCPLVALQRGSGLQAVPGILRGGRPWGSVFLCLCFRRGNM